MAGHVRPPAPPHLSTDEPTRNRHDDRPEPAIARSASGPCVRSVCTTAAPAGVHPTFIPHPVGENRTADVTCCSPVRRCSAATALSKMMSKRSTLAMSRSIQRSSRSAAGAGFSTVELRTTNSHSQRESAVQPEPHERRTRTRATYLAFSVTFRTRSSRSLRGGPSGAGSSGSAPDGHGARPATDGSPRSRRASVPTACR